MSDHIMAYIIAGALLLGVLFLIYCILSEKKRKQTLAAIAQEFKLTFGQDDTLDIPASYAAFQLFSAGKERMASNIMHGMLGGTPIKIFDYKYVTGGADESTTHNTTVVLADTEYLFKYVGLQSERFFGKIFQMIGLGDLEIGMPEFDRAFRITAEDAEFARQLLQKNVADFLLQSRDPHLHIEFSRKSLIVHKDRRLKPDKLGTLVKFTLELIRKLPADLPRGG